MKIKIKCFIKKKFHQTPQILLKLFSKINKNIYKFPKTKMRIWEKIN